MSGYLTPGKGEPTLLERLLAWLKERRDKR